MQSIISTKRFYGETKEIIKTDNVQSTRREPIETLDLEKWCLLHDDLQKGLTWLPRPKIVSLPQNSDSYDDDRLHRLRNIPIPELSFERRQSEDNEPWRNVSSYPSRHLFQYTFKMSVARANRKRVVKRLQFIHTYPHLSNHAFHFRGYEDTFFKLNSETQKNVLDQIIDYQDQVQHRTKLFRDQCRNAEKSIISQVIETRSTNSAVSSRIALVSR